MKYILIKRRQKPIVVTATEITKAGNIRLPGVAKVMRKSRSYKEIHGSCFVYDDSEAYEFSDENFDKAVEIYQRDVNNERVEQERRRKHREEVETRLAKRLAEVQSKCKEAFDRIWDSKLEKICKNRYEEGDAKFCVFSGEIPANPDMNQEFAYVTGVAKYHDDESKWRISYTMFFNTSGGASTSTSSENLEDCLWEMIRDTYFCWN